MATYAIGDIQGCFASLQQLLKHIHFDQTKDRLWLVGDLVNRGHHSLETLRFVKGLGKAAITVLGNHDLHLLMLAEGHSKNQRGDTLDDILQAPDRIELLDWLRHQPLMHSEGSYVMVHAGLLPDWTVEKALTLAREVEASLQSDIYRECLANMWGNEPANWSDDLTGWARTRSIVNAMTRMRFCTAEGVMEFRTKGEVSDTPEGYQPWFEIADRKSADSLLITGHWSALGLRNTSNHLALDTGCLWGGKLTAVRLSDKAVFQVDCMSEDLV